jgi:hypothetical protein
MFKTERMKSKPAILILALSAAITFSCKEKQQGPQTSDTETAPATAKTNTYAEISVKKGGQWQGKEYKGGSFENVTELTLPKSHTDHSFYIRYEGPGWENAQVGYRLYLDWRNAIDIFGKKTDSMVLAQVGKDGFASYHDPAPWGQDILKAGKALGIGGYGRFMNDSVAHFREVEQTRAEVSNLEGSSKVEIDYTGWKTGSETIDLKAVLTIYPEDRFTKVTLDPSAPLNGLATGLVKFKGIDLLQKQSENGEWAYIATYGAQTLVNGEDKLGMALFYKTTDLEEVKEGPHDHLLIFKEGDGPITYYLLAAWEQEPKGIVSQEAFLADMESKLAQLQKNGSLE